MQRERTRAKSARFTPHPKPLFRRVEQSELSPCFGCHSIGLSQNRGPSPFPRRAQPEPALFYDSSPTVSLVTRQFSDLPRRAQPVPGFLYLSQPIVTTSTRPQLAF